MSGGEATGPVFWAWVLGIVVVAFDVSKSEALVGQPTAPVLALFFTLSIRVEPSRPATADGPARPGDPPVLEAKHVTFRRSSHERKHQSGSG